MEGKRRVLGIDPGSRSCGYGVIDVFAKRKPIYVECGVLQFPAKDTLSDRLHQLFNDLKEMIEDLCPEELALEAIFHSKNVQSAFRLGYARAIVMLLAAEYKLPLHEYSPNTVKKQVAGYGHAAKEEVQRMVMWHCGLRHIPQVDAADALAIALCHAFHGLTHGIKRAYDR